MKLSEFFVKENGCTICGLQICKCGSEEEEVEYKGKKITVGKHSDVTDGHYNHHELAMGIEVELEHTSDERIAKSIAKDHLSEVPDYYSRLKKMEYAAKGTESFKSYAEKLHAK